MFCALFLLFSHKLRLSLHVLYVCRIKNICDKNTPRKVKNVFIINFEFLIQYGPFRYSFSLDSFE